MHASVPPTRTTSARSSWMQVEPERDRLGAGRAGADGGVHAGARADLEPDVGGRTVGHVHRDEQRRDPARALLEHDVVLGEQAGDAADAGADHDRDPRSGRGRPRPSGRSKPASAHASRAATSAACSLRSRRRASLRSRQCPAGSTVIGAAMRTERSAAQSSVERDDAGPALEQAGPVTSRRRRRAAWSRPSPVTTTSRRRSHGLRRSTRCTYRVADGLELRQFVVGDLDAELLLGGHRDLDHRQRVDVEVVDEALLVADVAGATSATSLRISASPARISSVVATVWVFLSVEGVRRLGMDGVQSGASTTWAA